MQYQPMYYVPMPPRRRFPIGRVILFVVLMFAVIAGYFLFFSTKPPPDGYMNTEYGLTVQVLRYLHWTEVNGQVNGYWSVSEVKSVDAKPIYEVGAIKGSHSGNMFNLMFYYPDGSSGPSTAILENNTLTLQSPARDGTVDSLTFRGVLFKEYSQELDNFKATYG